MMSMGKKATKEKSFLDIVRMVQQNTALFLIGINRYYGKGSKSLNNFLNFYEELTLEFQGYDKDGVTQEKILSELKQIGIEPSRIFEDIPPMKEFRAKKQDISIAELHSILPGIKAMDMFRKDLEGLNDSKRNVATTLLE